MTPSPHAVGPVGERKSQGEVTRHTGLSLTGPRTTWEREQAGVLASSFHPCPFLVKFLEHNKSRTLPRSSSAPEDAWTQLRDSLQEPRSSQLDSRVSACCPGRHGLTWPGGTLPLPPCTRLFQAFRQFSV